VEGARAREVSRLHTKDVFTPAAARAPGVSGGAPAATVTATPVAAGGYDPSRDAAFRNDTQKALQDLAGDGQRFDTWVGQVFGDVDPGRKQALREQLVQGRAGELLPAARMTYFNDPRVRGAYVPERQEVYLAGGLDKQTARKVYLEEVGHHLQNVLGGGSTRAALGDRLGDEGAAFAASFEQGTGGHLRVNERPQVPASERTQDDVRSLKLRTADGNTVSVKAEFNWLKDTFQNGVDFVKDGLTSVGDVVKDVFSPGNPVFDGLLPGNPIVDSLLPGNPVFDGLLPGHPIFDGLLPGHPVIDAVSDPKPDTVAAPPTTDGWFTKGVNFTKGAFSSLSHAVHDFAQDVSHTIADANGVVKDVATLGADLLFAPQNLPDAVSHLKTDALATATDAWATAKDVVDAPGRVLDWAEANILSPAAGWVEEHLAEPTSAFLHKYVQDPLNSGIGLGLSTFLGGDPEQWKHELEGVEGTLGDFMKGVAEGGIGLVEGVLAAELKPLETMENLARLGYMVATDPHGAWDAVSEPYRQAIADGHPAEAAGRALVDSLALVVGGLKAGKDLTELGKAARGAESLAETTRAAAASMENREAALVEARDTALTQPARPGDEVPAQTEHQNLIHEREQQIATYDRMKEHVRAAADDLDARLNDATNPPSAEEAAALVKARDQLRATGDHVEALQYEALKDHAAHLDEIEVAASASAGAGAEPVLTQAQRLHMENVARAHNVKITPLTPKEGGPVSGFMVEPWHPRVGMRIPTTEIRAGLLKGGFPPDIEVIDPRFTGKESILERYDAGEAFNGKGGLRGGAPARKIPGGDNAVVTANGNFLIPKAGLDDFGGSKEIYVREGGEPPDTGQVSLKKDPETYTHNGVRYTRYTISGKVVADCLHTAEELMHNAKFNPNAGDVRSKVSRTNTVFGDTHEGNIAASREIATLEKGAHVNHSASPEVGQAYAVVRQGEPGVGESPYHAATVVARDGKHTVTLETSAGTADGVRRNTSPKFYVQEVGSKEKSFHAQMTEMYGENAITLVLDPLTQEPAPIGVGG
jgi:hypothetical protein